MRLCKKINKDTTKYRTIYYDKEIDLVHNSKGPAEIYFDEEKEDKFGKKIITQFVYKEYEEYKNRRKGPIYVNLNTLLAQWGLLSTGYCIKLYHKNFSIKSIETYDRYGNMKSIKHYKYNCFFDNIRNEIKIAKEWV